jgi:predicted GNAT family acetyltransferase
LQGLRVAVEDDAPEVARIHAEAYLEQHGVDPSQPDPASYHKRVLARIRQGRVWIIRQDDCITFKADVASETAQAVYLEGVWTRPSLRRTGIGSSALKDLCQRLLSRSSLVCLFVDALEQHLANFYQRIGFEMHASYRLIRYSH